MIVRFWDNFNKKNNSFKIPGNDLVHTDFEGDLKTPSSVIRPVINLRLQYNHTNPVNNGYAYIPEFGRYYHIVDWTYNSGIWSASMVVDPLASFKNQILNDNAFVLYSTNNYNINLIDSRLSNNYKMDIVSADGTIFDTPGNVYGCFALNVISDAGRWGVATYILDGMQLSTLMSTLSIETASEFKDQMEQLFAGASINSIISCTWLPWRHESSGDTVHVGAYDTTVQCKKIDYPENYIGTDITIPWPYNDWRMSSSFCNAFLYLPYYGVVSLPVDKILNCTKIKISCSVDYSTGGATYLIEGDNNVGYIDIISFNIGCNMPISGMSIDPYGALKSGVSGTASVFNLNFGSTAEAAFETVEALSMPESTITGAYGQSRSNAQVYIRTEVTQLTKLWIYYRQFSDNPADLANNIGRPLKSVVNLSTLTGYVQCANYSSSVGLDEEVDMINNYMNGGAYIE